MNRADYRPSLLKSAETGEYQTARDVPPGDVNRLTHQIRYQAQQLHLKVHIETDPETGTVSFLASPQ